LRSCTSVDRTSDHVGPHHRPRRVREGSGDHVRRDRTRRVWKSTSGGSDFQPIFDDVGMMSIGCVTVSQSNPDLVWVGTGEVNNRQTTSFGDGVYKSTDGGKTFQKMGLARSQHVARIVIDPYK
jgi:hypothetical protein